MRISYNIDNEKPTESCGIVGIYSSDQDISRLTYLGIYSLQHRGQESAGITTSDFIDTHSISDLGLITNVFKPEDFGKLKGNIGIGHTRYSTTGSHVKENAQPLNVYGTNGELSFAHNGNVINSSELRERLLSEYDIEFKTSTDSEILALLYANAVGKNWLEKSNYCMRLVKGAYSLVMMTKDTLIGVRDPLGIRPLCLGKTDDAWILSSESSALAHIGAEFVREIENGETVVINKNGIESIKFNSAPKQHRLCIFEQIYFH